MTEQRPFLVELENTVSQGAAESRLRALWYATDILMGGTILKMKYGRLGKRSDDWRRKSSTLEDLAVAKDRGY